MKRFRKKNEQKTNIAIPEAIFSIRYTDSNQSKKIEINPSVLEIFNALSSEKILHAAQNIILPPSNEGRGSRLNIAKARETAPVESRNSET